MFCETAILKDVIITNAECSIKPIYYYLPNKIRKLTTAANTLNFCVRSIGMFYYETDNFIEIKEIMEGIENWKRFTIKYIKSSHEVIEIISETNTQENIMEKYNEILRLKEMLIQHGMPFDFSEWLGGYHICYPSKDNVICSVVENDVSYGRDKDKLEIQGLLTEQELEETGDTVLGHLTAEGVFNRICQHFTKSGKVHKESEQHLNNNSSFKALQQENEDLIKQLAKCSDKIKELENTIKDLKK